MTKHENVLKSSVELRYLIERRTHKTCIVYYERRNDACNPVCYDNCYISIVTQKSLRAEIHEIYSQMQRIMFKESELCLFKLRSNIVLLFQWNVTFEFVDFMSRLANERRHILHARKYTRTQILSVKIRCSIRLASIWKLIHAHI